MEENISNVVKMFPAVEQNQKVVIGIDGLSRAGKTTFVSSIERDMQEKKIPVCIFHIDDYIVERKRRYHTGYEAWYEYYYLQWDINYLRKYLFERLKETKELQLRTYDDLADTQSLQTIKLLDTCLIIIEGVFLQRKEWRKYYDFMIYLDSPREKRFHRESQTTRNNIEKFEKRYWKAEDYYMETVSPIENADIVVRN
ncbi:kinase [Sediminibacillus halophilus]|uniref:Uridine kinase n=1 Tax=Sediminibacillus halophilus TaxID=482461 RepID=A0A1G9T4J3_9BACI|nr:kinase [Sediminibacillus halophilus]SDM41975.1 uridine kinase [Sediminibacillus halophilus]